MKKMKKVFWIVAGVWLLLGCASRQPLPQDDMVCGNSEFEHLFEIVPYRNRAAIVASVRDTYTQTHFFVRKRRIGTVPLKAGEKLLFENNRTVWNQEGDTKVGPVRLYRVSSGRRQLYGAFFSIYDGEHYRYRWEEREK